jgi:two-component system chemotaxis sensor kinase CheA
MSIKQENQPMVETTDVFFEETSEILSGIDRDFLKLEKLPLDQHYVDLLFRKIHTMKGGLGAIPHSEDLSLLVHELESILSDFKKNEYFPDPHSIDLFLFCTQLIRRWFVHLRVGSSPTEDILNETNKSKKALANFRENKGRFVQVESFWKQKKTQETEVTQEDGAFLSSSQMEHFVHLSNELIILKNFYEMATKDIDLQKDFGTFQRFQTEFTQNLNKLTDQLQHHIAGCRQVPLLRMVDGLPRIVRTLAQDSGKKVKIDFQGFEIKIEKKLAQALTNCLVHLIRNSVDHGIETPHQRLEQGKNPEGQIVVRAHCSADIITIDIMDDGAGIDLNRISQKILKKGLATKEQLDLMTEDQKIHFIYFPGFSTKEDVSEVSGRGVGMDVVLETIKSFSGTIRTQTHQGKGTQFSMIVPIPKTVVVNKSILTEWNGFYIAIPLTSVGRIVSCNEVTFTEIGQQRFAQIDSRSVLALSYDELLVGQKLKDLKSCQSMSIVYMRDSGREFALMIDRIVNQIEVVVRPFDDLVKSVKGFSGTSILGQDDIAYVIDPKQFVHQLSEKEYSSANVVAGAA